MKTLITVYCLLFTGLALAQPWSDVTLSQPEVAAATAACNTTHATNALAQGSVHYGGTARWTGQSGYDPGSNISVCKLYFTATLENGVVYKASIWNQASIVSALGSQVGSYSATATGNGSANQVYSFEFASSISITNGGFYALVISRNDNADLNGANMSVSLSAAGGIGGYMGRWLSTGAMDDWDTTDAIMAVMK